MYSHIIELEKETSTKNYAPYFDLYLWITYFENKK